ncbi:IDEAL domain-containing protein [Halalkalibacterium halodurans]|nr:IDEAL domain-containing protein [Halalkalibacterium halodurans]
MAGNNRRMEILIRKGMRTMSQHFAMERQALRQLRKLRVEKRPESVLQSLYAQAILEYAIFAYRKKEIDEAIDQALEKRDQDAFMSLTNKRQVFIDEYKNGKIVEEQGHKLQLLFF